MVSKYLLLLSTQYLFTLQCANEILNVSISIEKCNSEPFRVFSQSLMQRGLEITKHSFRCINLVTQGQNTFNEKNLIFQPTAVQLHNLRLWKYKKNGYHIMKFFKKLFYKGNHNKVTDKGKYLSEALIFASTNPKYDNRVFIELQVQYMKIPSSNLGRTCSVQKLFLTFRTIFVHNIFSSCSE